jgi:hypothetical protein
MTTMTDISQQDLVELDERESNGIRVTLLWNRVTNRASVRVSDEQSGEAFAVEIRDEGNPLDVFHHPFAYAAHGLVTELVPTGGTDLSETAASLGSES